MHQLFGLCAQEIPLIGWDTPANERWIEERCWANEVWIVTLRSVVTAAMVFDGTALWALGTHPDHRRQGAARALLRRAQALKDSLVLHVAPGNVAAAALLASMNFVHHEGDVSPGSSPAGRRHIHRWSRPAGHAYRPTSRGRSR